MLAAACGVVWAVVMLFVPRPAAETARPVTLRPDAAAPDLDLLYKRIRETPPAPSRADWAPDRLRADWDWLVIHHSASLSGNARIFDRYHRTKEKPMENGLAYHFVIGNGHGSGDGEVEVGHRWTGQLDGGHVRGDELNHIAIGICLVGDFEQAIPTEKQIASLKALINYLIATTPITDKRIRGHCRMEGQKTVCPGRYLPVSEIVRHRFGPTSLLHPAGE